MTDPRGAATDQPHPPFEAYTGDKPYIFISYGHRDSALVYPELQRLYDLGYRLWYDEGIDPGNEWPEEIAKAVKNCAVFVVMISPRSVESPNVNNEIRFALGRRKPFLAIHIEETELPDGLDLSIGSIQAILRYRMPPDRYERKMEKVLPADTLDPARAAGARGADAAPSRTPHVLPPAPSPAPSVAGPGPQKTPDAAPAPAAPAPKKMFYTREEAAQQLGVGEDFLKEKVFEGALREFRDGPRVMFKREDIERLASMKGRKPPEEDGLLDLTRPDDGGGLLQLTRDSDDDFLLTPLENAESEDGSDVIALDEPPPAGPPPGDMEPLDLTRKDDSGLLQLTREGDDDFLLTPLENSESEDGSKVISLLDVDDDLLDADALKGPLKPSAAAVGPRPVPPVTRPFQMHLPPQLPGKATARVCWGIDVGNSGVAAVRLKAADGDVQAAGLFLQPFSRLLNEPGVNARASIVTAVRQFVDKCFADNEGVFAAVPGHLVQSGTFAIPSDQLKKTLAGDAALRSAIRIPIAPDELAWDAQAVFTGPTAAEVAVMAIRKKDRAAVTDLLKEAGLQIDGLAPGPAAALNAIAYQRRLERGSPAMLILDIGAASTDLISTAGLGGSHNEVIRMVGIPIGGDHFTDAIAKTLKVDFATAENLKRTAATSKYAKQIFQAMRQVFQDFAAAIAGFVRGPFGVSAGIAMGPMSRMPGLCKYLTQNLTVEITPLAEFQRTKVMPNVAGPLGGHEHQCAVAYGLALQGLGLGMLTFNLAARPKSLLGRLFGGR
jgi:excisionase family DNA binding protein